MNHIQPLAPAVPVAAPAPPPHWAAAWRGAGALLLAGLLLLGLLFRAEILAAVTVWDESTAYNHCWLVLPIAGWLAWNRRHRLAPLLPQPLPWLALLALPIGLVWLAAERLGIMEGRQFAALGLMLLFTVTVLGWRFGRAMAGPLLYLLFLVPFGAFATPQLQDITAWFVDVGLNFTQIPHYISDLTIEIPAGTFYVAEACAGLRFLIAALAFGALYALTMFRSPWRRLVVMALALAVPIIANGIRALGIVVLGNYLGSAEAAAADHLIYGWVFFSAVILLLILAGLPFREDVGLPPMGPVPPPHMPASTARLALAGGLGLGLAALAPAGAGALDAAAGGAQPLAAPSLTAPEGCTATPGELRCGELRLRVDMLGFPPGGTWGLVVAARRQAETGAAEEDTTFTVNEPGRALWQGRLRADGAGAVASAAWLGGGPVGDGVRTRLRQARNSLLGGAGRPVLAVARVAGVPPGPRGAAALRALLQAQDGGLVATGLAQSATR